MKLRRLLSAVTALLLVCSLPVSVLAAEYDLAKGSITVTATADGQTVTHGDNDAVQDDAPVIIQTNIETATTNTITIKAEENTTANVTIQDVNIVISDPSGSPQDHSGQAAVTIDVAENAEANVTLDGVNINTKNTGGLSYNPGTGDFELLPGEAAVQITGNGDVTLELDGENTLQSGYKRAGVEKNTTNSSGNGNLTITNETGTPGSLQSTGGVQGAGIGGGDSGSGSNITITGSAEVNAQGGDCGAGIGGGISGSGSNITITGSAEVTATSSRGGAGIGGGISGSGSNITITGSAEVTATSSRGGAGIGGGDSGSGSNITITGSVEVTAQGGDGGSGIGGGSSGTGNNFTVSGDAQVKSQGGNATGIWGAGAAIGNGGAQYQNGQEVTPNTNDLNEGWVATYAPGTQNMNTAGPDSLTYKDNGQLTTSSNAVAVARQEPTCTQDGHEAGFSVDGALVAVTIPKTGHSFTNYVPDGKATCTADGTKTAQCDHAGCKATDTVTDPGTMKEHSFTNYISDNNATYTSDGTKTAKCDACDATHTIPDPGTRLPFYKVKGQDGAQLRCEEQKQDGVLTIEVDADCASLTGTFGGMKALKARGVDTIVFVTKGATSTFAVEDLLAQGASGDTYSLTHDGEQVTFTLGNGTDIAKILK